VQDAGAGNVRPVVIGQNRVRKKEIKAVME
jgi:hypothetical protein